MTAALPALELAAAFEACALADRSDLARFGATGPGFLALLHRLSTGDVQGLAPGEGRSTVLTTPKGRIVERLFVHHLGAAGVLAVGGSGRAAVALAHLARYALREAPGLADWTDATCQFVLLGPALDTALGELGLSRPAPLGVVEVVLDGLPLRLLGQDGSSTAGVSIVTERAHGPACWERLAQGAARAGGRPVGGDTLECWRVLRGLPASGHELTEAHNPLEAGLWDAVSFAKGCYVGQEVVARLRTYDKIARGLVGLELPVGPLPEPATPLFLDRRPIGELTSAVRPPGAAHGIALGYVKRAALGAPAVAVGAAEGPAAPLVALPFRR